VLYLQKKIMSGHETGGGLEQNWGSVPRPRLKNRYWV